MTHIKEIILIYPSAWELSTTALTVASGRPPRGPLGVADHALRLRKRQRNVLELFVSANIYVFTFHRDTEDS